MNAVTIFLFMWSCNFLSFLIWTHDAYTHTHFLNAPKSNYMKIQFFDFLAFKKMHMPSRVKYILNSHGTSRKFRLSAQGMTLKILFHITSCSKIWTLPYQNNQILCLIFQVTSRRAINKLIGDLFDLLIEMKYSWNKKHIEQLGNRIWKSELAFRLFCKLAV